MKRIICLIIFLISVFPVFAEEPDKIENLSLGDVYRNADNFRGKEITLILKLKNRDMTFEKIVFYDRRNRDIEFDISHKEIKKSLANAFLNLHEGLNYKVRFIVRSISSTGGIIGKLISFEPILVDKLP